MEKYKDKNWLKRKYLIEKLNIIEIGQLCNANTGTIYYFLKKFGIQTRHEAWNKNLKGIYSQKTLDAIANQVSQAWKDGRLGDWQKNQPKTFQKCIVCGKEFRISPSEVKKVKCCSKKCRIIWMSLVMKGKNKKDLPIKKCKNCGKEFRVRSFREARTNNFCSKKCYIKWYRGPNHKQWTGRSTLRQILYQRKENIEWRNIVFKKDNYICQKCGVKSGDGKTVYLQAHHIKNWKDYPLFRYKISNGIVFCKECHQLFHKTYGFKENNEKQLNEFLENNIYVNQLKNSLAF